MYLCTQTGVYLFSVFILFDLTILIAFFIFNQVKYFEDFSSKLGLNIQYNTEIKKVKKDTETGIFTLTDQLGKNHSCHVLIIRYVIHPLLL